jgi:HEAT repeat protein
VNKLYDRLGGETDLDLSILDTISTLQINDAYEKVNDILSSEPDIVIHSLNAIGDLGDSSAIAPVRKLLFNEPEDPNIRFAAYEALGGLPSAKGAFALASGLEDPVDNVKAGITIPPCRQG